MEVVIPWKFLGYEDEDTHELNQRTTHIVDQNDLNNGCVMFKGIWEFTPNGGGEIDPNPGESEDHRPVIHASDQTLNGGDVFDPLAGVTATDVEDGVLTHLLAIFSNNVDTSKAGKYTVTYMVTDSDGNTTTKTITVTVVDSNNQQPVDPNHPEDPNKPGQPNDSNKPSNPDQSNQPDKDTPPNTAVGTNIALWLSTIFLSIGTFSLTYIKTNRRNMI